jgi:hypothetical protein
LFLQEQIKDIIIWLDVLFATICAWAGLWGCLDELVQNIKNDRGRYLVFLMVLAAPLLVVTLQSCVSLCSLLWGELLHKNKWWLGTLLLLLSRPLCSDRLFFATWQDLWLSPVRHLRSEVAGTSSGRPAHSLGRSSSHCCWPAYVRWWWWEEHRQGIWALLHGEYILVIDHFLFLKEQIKDIIIGGDARLGFQTPGMGVVMPS